MKKTITIQDQAHEAATDIALDTISINKQALIFVNSKRSAEAAAERVAKKCNKEVKCSQLAHEILHVLASSTKQCRRLAYCVERGAAFHHAGLASKQRTLVEDAFRAGSIKIIAATPTLAAGIDTPAFRTIIRDTKRFSGGGMKDIAVLEYHQMAGRSGRPDFQDEFGEAILIAKNDKDAQQLLDKFVHGLPEEIYSKVASLPVLRTYCLSLVATEFVTTRKELDDFFQDTFFAHQFGDTKAITGKISSTIQQLQEWNFLKSSSNDFVSAKELSEELLIATPLGKRVSELYLDPYTAHLMINGLIRAKNNRPESYALTQLLCTALEMRPLLRMKTADYPLIEEFLEKEPRLLVTAPSMYDPEYDSFLSSIKTANMLAHWMEEKTEEYLLEEYSVTPGELRYRIDRIDWLCYSTSELARLLKMHHLRTPLYNLRTRIKYGVREELLALLRFKGIGRVRARKLFRAKIKTIADVKKASENHIASIIGPKLAKQIIKEAG